MFNDRNSGFSIKRIVGFVALGIAGIVLLIAVFGSWVSVDSGHVGVKKTMGAVNADELQEGLNFKLPLVQSVVQVDARLRPHQAKAGAASKDLQEVSTEITVSYSLVGGFAAETYQRIGTREQVEAAIIDPAIQESLKQVTAAYTAEQLITMRDKVKAEVTSALKSYITDALEEKNLKGALAINSVAITDFDFSPEFNKAIEAKVTAEQEALKAKNEKEKQITQAEAEAQSQKLRADAKAYEIEAESKARAAAIEREAKALAQNPNLVQLRATERWDGKLPQYNGGGAVPFINIPGPGAKPDKE